jgi:hypothetical protein
MIANTMLIELFVAISSEGGLMINGINQQKKGSQKLDPIYETANSMREFF